MGKIRFDPNDILFPKEIEYFWLILFYWAHNDIVIYLKNGKGGFFDLKNG